MARTIPRPSTAMSVLLVVLLTVVLTPLLGPTAGAAPRSVATAEAELLSHTNGARQASGLGAMTNDVKAASVARAWSQEMARTGTLQHNPNLASHVSTQVTSQWTRIGENVGYGWSAKQLHDAFMASPGHRANVLGAFNRVGVGAAIDGTGRLWVTLVFINGPTLAPAANLPFGNVDSVRGELGVATISGWAIDLDTLLAPVDVHVYVNGRWGGSVSASQARLDIAQAFPLAGAAHGFSMSMNLGRGIHKVCAYGIDPTGKNPLLGCRDVAIGGPAFGSIDSVQEVPGGYVVSGWAIDPDTKDPIAIHSYTNGRWAGAMTADVDRPDVGRAYPAFGSRHGYRHHVAGGHGWHRICTYGIDPHGWDTNPVLGCVSRWRDARPTGSLDSVTAGPGQVSVAGWLIDPDTTAAGTVHVYVDGRWGGLAQANHPRADVGLAYPAYGPDHGYRLDIPVAPGPRQICVYGIDAVTNVGNPLIGCTTVTVAAP